MSKQLVTMSNKLKDSKKSRRTGIKQVQSKKIQQQIPTQAKKGEHKELNANKYNQKEQLKQHKNSNNKCKISKEQTTTNCQNC